MSAVEMAPFPGFLKISWGLKNAVGMQAAPAPRPARPSRQHPMQQFEGLVKAKNRPLATI